MRSLWLCVCICVFVALVNATVPNLTLPWGTWQAEPYADKGEIYIFRNVRFGSEPVRFGPSSYPAFVTNNSILQNSSYGPSCIQIDRDILANPPGGRTTIRSSSFGGGDVEQSEDCLFLDIYVPVSVFASDTSKIPVAVWLYGGAYSFGSKLLFGPKYPFYTGQGLLESSSGEFIFVAGNYRLGAFGWLAGSYMEETGLPNAGLYDQRLLFQWVYDYIGLVGGDRRNVTAMGESAGAGSILHHLIRDDGSTDPLFKRAILQSPAFAWQWNRHGTLNDVFLAFSNLTRCGAVFDIKCLRENITIDELRLANQGLFETVAQTGLYPVGPSIDGAWITELAAISFMQGRYWRDLESIMVSHVANESGSFIPLDVVSNVTFQNFVYRFMPEPQLDETRARIYQQYDCEKNYTGDYKLCVSMLIRDSMLTCNTRVLYDAYMGKAYMMQYSWPGGTYWLHQPEALHSTDLVPTFINDDTNITALLVDLGGLSTSDATAAAGYLRSLKLDYQSYLSSFVIHGDPNTGNVPWSYRWPPASGTEDLIKNVMDVRGSIRGWRHDFYAIIADPINTKSSCDFWNEVAVNISKVSSRNHSDSDLFIQGSGLMPSSSYEA